MKKLIKRIIIWAMGDIHARISGVERHVIKESFGLRNALDQSENHIKSWAAQRFAELEASIRHDYQTGLVSYLKWGRDPEALRTAFTTARSHTDEIRADLSAKTEGAWVAGLTEGQHQKGWYPAEEAIANPTPEVRALADSLRAAYHEEESLRADLVAIAPLLPYPMSDEFRKLAKEDVIEFDNRP